MKTKTIELTQRQAFVLERLCNWMITMRTKIEIRENNKFNIGGVEYQKQTKEAIIEFDADCRDLQKRLLKIFPELRGEV